MIFFIFILWFLLAESIIFVVRFLLRKVDIELWLKIIIIVLEVVISIALAYLAMATNVGYWFISPLMFALNVALLMDASAQVIYLVIRIFHKNHKRIVLLSILSNVLGVAFLTFGMINMQVVSPKYLSYSSSKLSNTYKVAFVSDVHVGSSQTLETTLNTINAIKNQNADFTIIGGDLIDEYTTKSEMESVAKAFGEFTNPVYFIRGNHDLTGEVTINELEASLTSAGVKVVVDEFIKLADDLTLLGREDLSNSNRKKITDLVNPCPSSYLLVADHQPFAFEENCKIGLDLQLSGHTHAGQLFPLNWIYSLAVHSYGEYRYQNSILNVSSGASGWQNPLRTEIGCQYEIITLSPSNN
ncbi:MAG: metallophosphoesterase [Bacilli bacterium]|nr:metallophosphoesterase [Bacilli bacterium]